MMNEENQETQWPNWRKGRKWGIRLGALAAFAWMGWLGFVSTLPAITPVSISNAVSPWWRLNNWILTLVVSGFVFAITTISVATRPRKKSNDNHKANRTS